jgi:hypothetical protein
MARAEGVFTDHEHAIQHRLSFVELALHAVEICQCEQRHCRKLMIFAGHFLGLRDQPLRVRNRLRISARPRQLSDAPHESREVF